MYTYKYLLFAVAFLVWAPQTYAACTPDACISVDVTTLYTNANGVIYVGTSGDESLLNCSAVSNVYVSILPADPGARDMYALLLAA